MSRSQRRADDNEDNNDDVDDADDDVWHQIKRHFLRRSLFAAVAQERDGRRPQLNHGGEKNTGSHRWTEVLAQLG